MKRVKIFKEYTIDEMEIAINKWIKINPQINIISINPTDSSSQHGARNPICYILYDTSSEFKLNS